MSDEPKPGDRGCRADPARIRELVERLESALDGAHEAKDGGTWLPVGAYQRIEAVCDEAATALEALAPIDHRKHPLREVIEAAIARSPPLKGIDPGWFKLVASDVATDIIAELPKAPAEPLVGEGVPGLRPEVIAFARLMEDQLKANDHKPGWKGEDWWPLLMRMREETIELQEALAPGSRTDLPAWWTRVGCEAADVANFALMIADVCGALH